MSDSKDALIINIIGAIRNESFDDDKQRGQSANGTSIKWL